MSLAYVALGSNRDDPAGQLRRALDELDTHPATRVVARSALYRSTPMGPQDQPDYLNAVVALETGLEPGALLAVLQALEVAHGRRRSGERWGPRRLDLDILLYDHLTVSQPGLEIPHPGLTSREFVIVPLHEIAPDLTLPDGTGVADLHAGCRGPGLTRLDDEEP